jgi:hypothetical protein
MARVHSIVLHTGSGGFHLLRPRSSRWRPELSLLRCNADLMCRDHSVADGLAFNAVWNAGMLQVKPLPRVFWPALHRAADPTAADGGFSSLSRKQIARIRCTTEECRVTIENLAAVAAEPAPAEADLSETILAIADASASKWRSEK